MHLLMMIQIGAQRRHKIILIRTEANDNPFIFAIQFIGNAGHQHRLPGAAHSRNNKQLLGHRRQREGLNDFLRLIQPGNIMGGFAPFFI